MKPFRLFTLVLCLLIGMTAAAYASNFQASSKYSGTVDYKGTGWAFDENAYDVEIVFKRVSGSEMVLGAGKDKNLIYKNVMPYYKYVSIQQIYDTNSGKYAYIIQGANNQDGQGGFIYLMGYDSQKNTWQLYVNPDNYYNPIRGADPRMYVYNGQLILAFAKMGLHLPTQEYHFFWDSNSNWFGYKDYGVVQH